jgi:HAMP domain-containing protein
MFAWNKKLVLINRDFQLRYAAVGGLIGATTTVFAAIVILLPLFYFKLLVIPKFLPAPIFVLMGTVLFINILIIAVFGVYLTHRIAGPMFAISRFLRLLENGQYQGALHVRAKDELSYLVRNVNGLASSLRSRTASDLDRVDSYLSSNSSPNSGETSPEIKSLIQLRDQLQERLQSGNVN